eukprot:9436753-Alexandrium_andersonii.AAC.1
MPPREGPTRGTSAWAVVAPPAGGCLRAPPSGYILHICEFMGAESLGPGRPSRRSSTTTRATCASSQTAARRNPQRRGTWRRA